MTDYWLDTNALSELASKQPDATFVDWLAAADELTLFTSCMVPGEIKKGIVLAADSSQRQQYEHHLGCTSIHPGLRACS